MREVYIEFVGVVGATCRDILLPYYPLPHIVKMKGSFTPHPPTHPHTLFTPIGDLSSTTITCYSVLVSYRFWSEMWLFWIWLMLLVDWLTIIDWCLDVVVWSTMIALRWPGRDYVTRLSHGINIALNVCMKNRANVMRWILFFKSLRESVFLVQYFDPIKHLVNATTKTPVHFFVAIFNLRRDVLTSTQLFSVLDSSLEGEAPC